MEEPEDMEEKLPTGEETATSQKETSKMQQARNVSKEQAFQPMEEGSAQLETQEPESQSAVQTKDKQKKKRQGNWH